LCSFYAVYMPHTFHIPVLGLAYSVDTPVKVAHLGISSVTSIVDDFLLERMRKFHTEKQGWAYNLISTKEEDYRSKRITAYLDTLLRIIQQKTEAMKKESLAQKGDLTRYFELLPDTSALKRLYLQYTAMPDGAEKERLEEELKDRVVAGSADVNIMAKVDKMNYTVTGEESGSDALEALKGFADSRLESSVVLSAGMNPRLYSYLENFPDFFPDTQQRLRKRLILKVSDFRSALIQAKFLAKKGLWVSEFRIESGLNCGGHAFATEGYLLGPILEEFKNKRQEMIRELFQLYTQALEAKGIRCPEPPKMKISVQGGIGTAEENAFLMNYYEMDATGWGSPFLLVPEATTVDAETLRALTHAVPEDFYISNASPLGIPFNNFRPSTSEKQRQERIAKNRPGSPCTKKFLVSNTEFTEEPICTASREYQALKIKQLKQEEENPAELQKKVDAVTEKVCLCEGLATSAYLAHDILKPRENSAVAICPGPNLAYFSGSFSLEEMVKHIYGKLNLLSDTPRSHVFINELKLYVDYLRKDLETSIRDLKKAKYLQKFSDQLQNGINYYKELIPAIYNQTEAFRRKMMEELLELEKQVVAFQLQPSLSAGS